MSYGLWTSLLMSFAPFIQDAPQAQNSERANPYRSPQSTVRALTGFIELSREDPQQIQGAIECLDLSALPKGRQQGGILASKLDAILRARDIAPSLLPDDPDVGEFPLPELHGQRIVMRKYPDGRYRFDKDTVAHIPEMWMQVQQLSHDRNRELAALSVAPEFSTPRATYRTFLTSMHRFDQDRAVRCLDLCDVPSVCRAAVGAQLARRLKQVMDRQRAVSLVDIPNTNYADPFVWLSQPQGVIELARQYEGDRKGEWLFSSSTIAAIDPLYDAFEDLPYDPVLESLNVLHVRPDPIAAPELWFRSKLPRFWRAHVVAVKVLNFEVYQVPAFIIGLGLSWLFGLAARGLVQHALRMALHWKGIDLPAGVVDKRLRPLAALVAVLLACGTKHEAPRPALPTASVRLVAGTGAPAAGASHGPTVPPTAAGAPAL